MKNLIIALLFLCAVIESALAQSPIKHVVVIALENHEYSQVIGNANMPYYNKLANQGALATRFYATTHPSLPNYFRLTVGQHITNTNSYTGTVTADNIVRVLASKGLRWKNYAESLPYTGYLGPGTEPYARRHNPFAYFSDVKNSTTQRNRIVQFSQLATDLSRNTLPAFSFVQVNNVHNGHDCPNGGSSCSDTTKLVAVDNWLLSHVPTILNDPEFKQRGLLVIWWDEGTTNNYGGGRIPVVFLGPYAAAGAKVSTFYTHDHLLHTIGRILGFGRFPGSSAKVGSMTGMLKASALSTTAGVTISSPVDGSKVSSPVKVAASVSGGGSMARMELWVDGVKKYSNQGQTSLSTSVSLPGGNHRFAVIAVNTAGSKWSKVVYGTVI